MLRECWRWVAAHGEIVFLRVGPAGLSSLRGVREIAPPSRATLSLVNPPSAATKPIVYVPHPDDLEDVRAGLEEIERGETIRVTAEDLEYIEKTGEWPESWKLVLLQGQPPAPSPWGSNH
jgi:hypothetical protein